MIKLRERATLAGVSELRTIMRDILDETRTGPVILTRRNKPVGVILSYSEYNEMSRLVELLEDSTLGREAADRLGRKGRKTVSLAEAENKLVDVALVGFRRNEEAYDKMMRRVKALGFIRRRRSSRRP